LLIGGFALLFASQITLLSMLILLILYNSIILTEPNKTILTIELILCFMGVCFTVWLVKELKLREKRKLW